MKRCLLCVLLLLMGCDADLTTTCVGGDGTCDPHAMGGELPPPPCFDNCDIMNPSMRTGEFPCAVETVMENCRRCHSALQPPLMEGAPFFLDSYAESQEIYFGMAVWARMYGAISTDFMPLVEPKLSPEEKTVLLDEWACQCAPPREEGEVCE